MGEIGHGGEMKNLKKERKNGRKKFLDEVTRAFGGDNLGGGVVLFIY